MGDNILNTKRTKSFIGSVEDKQNNNPVIVLHGLSVFKKLDEDSKPKFEFSIKVIGEYLFKYKDHKTIVLLLHDSDIKLKQEFSDLIDNNPNFRFIETDSYVAATSSIINLLKEFGVNVKTTNTRLISVINFTNFIRDKTSVINVTTSCDDPYYLLKLTPEKELTFNDLMKARTTKWTM